jgi:Tol biopolymer transport system component
MKATLQFILAGYMLVLMACGSETVEIDYLGRKPPGITAELFAPGILGTNSNEHSAVAFSPDGSVMLWAIMDNQYRGRMFEMKYENGSWSKPTRPTFADTTTDDYSPSFSPDGKKLFFCSRRKAPDGYPKGNGNRIWSVVNTAEGWSVPEPIDTVVSRSQEFGHSIAKNGNLYFASTPGGPDLNIYQAVLTNGRFEKPVAVEAINSTAYEDGPYIAPDESYLIFESSRDGNDGNLDLFIVFKNNDGQWGAPVNMGSTINTTHYERFARVSPDGKYLFFASDREKSATKVGYDIYWIDARIIDELRRLQN